MTSPHQEGGRLLLRKLSPLCVTTHIILHISIALSAFNVGVMVGGHTGMYGCSDRSVMRDFTHAACECPTNAGDKIVVGSNNSSSSGMGRVAHAARREVVGTSDNWVFPKSVGGFVHGASRVKRNDFIATFDAGVPWDAPDMDNDDVLVLHTSISSAPTKTKPTTSVGPFPLYSLQDATENCNVVKVILIPPKRENECVALVGQWDSYHVHKFMRLPEHFTYESSRTSLSKEDPFRYASRNLVINGRGLDSPPPMLTHTSYLSDYLNKMPLTIERLKPVASRAAGSGRTVVAMLCNFGQSELLMNFVCAARSRRLDLSKVLLFATDNRTVELGESLGLNVFDVQDAFGVLPTDAAQVFRDENFSLMAMAKVYVVHLVNYLRYDVLFQDLDVVWYKDPIPLFHTKEVTGFDMLFQDDGGRDNPHIPYSANTGFYYARYNIRTEFFFSVLARLTDVVKASSNDQVAMNGLLSDFASWRGLKVKVFSKDDPMGRRLPGGYDYNMRKQFMKEILQGKENPYIFHMSWTKNKVNKIKFFQQIGEWYVEDRCVSKSVSEISVPKQKIPSECCSTQPLFQCHYRDKPSKQPCNNSPNFESGQSTSFW